MNRTVVIGGGIAGLAAATLLAREGHAVTLFEKNAEVGGRAGIHREGGFVFDTGPSWFLMPEVFDHFFRLCGTSLAAELDLVPLDPDYRILGDPRTGRTGAGTSAAVGSRGEGDAPYLDVRHGRTHVRALVEELEPGAWPAVESYLDSARRTYDLALDSFLHTSFASPRALVNSFANRRVLGSLGELPALLFRSLESRIAATVTHPVLRKILGYPAVFLGSSPSRVPSMYHLLSHADLDKGVTYPLGGMYRVIEAIERLARESGVDIRCGHEVTSLDVARGGSPFPRPTSGPAGAGGRGSRLGRGGTTGGRGLGRKRITAVTARSATGVERVETDTVVAACDLHHLDTHLLPRGVRGRSTRRWRKVDPGIGALVVCLGVEGRLPNLAHHTFHFAEDWTANFEAIFGEEPHLPDPASMYVCAPSVTDPSVAPDGDENLFLLVPVPADPTLGPDDPRVQAYADTMIERFAHAAGHPDLPERIRVRHLYTPGTFATDFHAFSGTALGPANVLRQSILLRGTARSRKLENLYPAGAFTAPGVGLPMCLISAQNVLKAVRGDASAGPLPVEDVPDADGATVVAPSRVDADRVDGAPDADLPGGAA